MDKNASKTRRCAALHGQRLWRGRFLLDERVATAVAFTTTLNTTPPPPSRTNWTRLVPFSRTNWARYNYLEYPRIPQPYRPR